MSAEEGSIGTLTTNQESVSHIRKLYSSINRASLVHFQDPGDLAKALTFPSEQISQWSNKRFVGAIIDLASYKVVEMLNDSELVIRWRQEALLAAMVGVAHNLRILIVSSYAYVGDILRISNIPFIESIAPTASDSIWLHMLSGFAMSDFRPRKINERAEMARENNNDCAVVPETTIVLRTGLWIDLSR